MILNSTYYKNLLEKYKNITTLRDLSNNVSCLTMKIVLENHFKNQAIHFNFQNLKETILEIGQNLFVELSNDIYKNHYDLPSLSKGNKLRDKRKYNDGKKHDFVIKNIINNTFALEDTKDQALKKLKYDVLVKNFIPIEQGAKQSTLQGYAKFFSDLNGDLKLDFTPTNFEKKIVFIAKKSLWDNLPNKNKVPCVYLPNPREEHNVTEIRSILALQDCMVYFTTKYEICYSNVLSKNERIKTIVVFDTEADKIEQMLQDKTKFGFNLIIISNSLLPIKSQSIPFWNWYKEEIEILNNL